MTEHLTKIKAKIELIQNTKQFQVFILWLLDDIEYGCLNIANEPDTIKAMYGVIDLYREWINTGKKPNEDRWIEAGEVAWECTGTGCDIAYYCAQASSEYENDRIYNSVFSCERIETDYGNNHLTITPSEIQIAQLSKLDELIQLKFMTSK